MRKKTSRLSAWSWFLETLSSLTGHLGRSLLNVVAVALGVGACVGTITLTDTVRHQVSDGFDVFRATTVEVRDINPSLATAAFSGESERAVLRVSGVTGAAVISELQPQVEASSSASNSDTTIVARLASLTPGGFNVTGAAITGRTHSWADEQTGALVAVVGKQVANSLGLDSVIEEGRVPVVVIDDVEFSVLGIIEDVDRSSELLHSVVIPDGTARRLRMSGEGSPARTSLLVSVAPGAAYQVASQLPVAINPATPERYQAITPPDPANLRRQVEGDVAGLVLAIGLVGLASGALAIANTTAVSVLQRTGELALRRALGARSIHVTAHVLGDASLLGAFGGLLGAVLGVAAAIAVSLARSWQPVVDIRLLIAAPILGGVLGLIAGLYPARLAAKVEPAIALR